MSGLKRSQIWLLVLLSFCLQLALGLVETYGDTKDFFVPWAQSILNNGASGFFTRTMLHKGTFYPPIAQYIFVGSYWSGQQIVKPILDYIWWLNTTLPFFPSIIVGWINRENLLYLTMKIPNIGANIALSLAIFKLSLLIKPKSSLVWARQNLLLLLFNPALFFLSAMWGQIDVLPLAFMSWAFYCMFTERSFSSLFLVMTALLVKQTTVIFLPFYLIAYWRYFGFSSLLKNSFLLYPLAVMIYWPFQVEFAAKLLPVFDYLKIAGSFASQSLSMHAHNLWFIAPDPGVVDTQPLFWLISPRLLALVITSVLLLTAIKALLTHQLNPQLVLGTVGIFILGSFLFLTRMHERHQILAMPFLLFISKDRRISFWLFVWATLYLLFNLYAAWPIPRINWLAGITNNHGFVSLLITIQILIYWYLWRRWQNEQLTKHQH